MSVFRRYAGFAVSLALLAWVVHAVGWSAIVEGFANLSAGWIAALTGLYVLGLCLRAWRWTCLLAPALPLPFDASAKIILVGNLLNNILPAKAGDIARAMLLKRAYGVGLSAGIMSVLIERIFDVLSLLSIFLAATLSVHVAEPYLGLTRSILATTALIFFGALSVLVALKAAPGFRGVCLRLAGRLPGSLAVKCGALLTGILDSLAFVRADRGFAAFVLLSAALWAVEGLTFYVGFLAFHVPGSVMEALFAFAVVNFSGLLPAAPGNVGVYQASMVYSFSMLALPVEPAVALSLVLPLVQILFNSGLGLLAMRSLGLDASFLRLARSGAGRPGGG